MIEKPNGNSVRRTVERASNTEAQEKRGSVPIIACIGPKEMYPAEDIVRLENIRKVAEKVDFYSDPKESKETGQSNAGEQTFVISTLSARPKFSEEYKNCMGLAVVGINKVDGKNISILTHQDPYFVLRKAGTAQFVKDLQGALENIKLSTVPGTVDAIIFGGDHSNKEGSIVYERRIESILRRTDDYVDMVEIVASTYKKVFNSDPHVVIGPKEPSPRSVEVLLDTEKRRLYMYRPILDKNMDQGFPAGKVGDYL